MILWKREGEKFSYEKTYNGFKSYLNECSFSHDDRFLVTGDNYGYIKNHDKRKRAKIFLNKSTFFFFR